MKSFLLAGILAVSATGCIIVEETPKHPAKSAEFEGWDALGTRDVNVKADHDVIDVKAGAGRFRSIAFLVKDAPVEVQSMKVTFANAEVYVHDLDHTFKEGSWSKRIDLPGDAREIRSIELTYRSTSPAEGHAHVTVFGHR
jgi:hypothetical protein